MPAAHATQLVAGLVSLSARPVTRKRTRVTTCLCQPRRRHRHVHVRTRIITWRERGLGWDAPAVQLAQVLAPAPEYCPAAQFTQAKNMPEILECLPEAQLWHAVLASPSLSYCPAAQLEHTVPPACADRFGGQY